MRYGRFFLTDFAADAIMTGKISRRTVQPKRRTLTRKDRT